MSAPEEPNPPAKGQFLVYQTDDGQIKIDVRLEGELQVAATVKEFLIVRQEGNRQVSRAVEHYNLDAIISVGYRVKSAVATQAEEERRKVKSRLISSSAGRGQGEGAGGFARNVAEILEA